MVNNATNNPFIETQTDQLQKLTAEDVTSVNITHYVPCGGGYRKEYILDPVDPEFKTHLEGLRQFEGGCVHSMKTISFTLANGGNVSFKNDEDLCDESIQEWLKLIHDSVGNDPNEGERRVAVGALFNAVIQQGGVPHLHEKAEKLKEDVRDFLLEQTSTLASTIGKPWLVARMADILLDLSYEDSLMLATYWVPRLNPLFLESVTRPYLGSDEFDQRYRDTVNNFIKFVNDPESIKEGWKSGDGLKFKQAIHFVADYTRLNVEATKCAETLDNTFTDPETREKLAEAFEIIQNEISSFQSVFECVKEELEENGDKNFANTLSNVNETIGNINEADKEILPEMAEDLLPKVINTLKFAQRLRDRLEEYSKELPSPASKLAAESELDTDLDTTPTPKSPKGSEPEGKGKEAKGKGEPSMVWLSEKAKEISDNPENVKKFASWYRYSKAIAKAFPSNFEKAMKSAENRGASDSDFLRAANDDQPVTSTPTPGPDADATQGIKGKDKEKSEKVMGESNPIKNRMKNKRNKRNRVVLEKKTPKDNGVQPNTDSGAKQSDAPKQNSGGTFSNLWKMVLSTTIDTTVVSAEGSSSGTRPTPHTWIEDSDDRPSSNNRLSLTSSSRDSSPSSSDSSPSSSDSSPSSRDSSPSSSDSVSSNSSWSRGVYDRDEEIDRLNHMFN